MARRAVVLGCVALMVMASIGATQEPVLELRIAKTARAVIAFGAADSTTVRVRLYKDRDTGSVLLAAQRVAVEEGSFRAKFTRPERGTCRVRVRTPDGRREDETFPCSIPDFSMSTAMLTSSARSSAVEIDVLIADEDAERRYGLMYRPRMRDDLGMAFLYEEDRPGYAGFWMQNTLIPLSIAFFDSNGVIVQMLDMDPCESDCRSYNPGVPYRGALEVNQGMFDEWGISEGDRVQVNDTP